MTTHARSRSSVRVSGCHDFPRWPPLRNSPFRLPSLFNHSVRAWMRPSVLAYLANVCRGSGSSVSDYTSSSGAWTRQLRRITMMLEDRQGWAGSSRQVGKGARGHLLTRIQSLPVCLPCSTRLTLDLCGHIDAKDVEVRPLPTLCFLPLSGLSVLPYVNDFQLPGHTYEVYRPGCGKVPSHGARHLTPQSANAPGWYRSERWPQMRRQHDSPIACRATNLFPAAEVQGAAAPASLMAGLCVE